MALSYRVSNGSVSKTCSASEMLATSEELVAGGALTIIQVNEDGSEKVILLDGISPGSSSPKKVEVILPPPPVAEVPSVDAPKAPSAPLYSEFGAGGQVSDAEALVRITEQRKVLAEKHDIHIDESQQLFPTATRMAKGGYDTMDERKKEWENRNLLSEEAEEFRSLIQAERREDQTCSAKDIADGLSIESGKLQVFGLTMRQQAVRGLCARLKSPVLSYLLGLSDRIADEASKGDKRDKAKILADKAKLADDLHYECLRNPDEVVKMRTRAENKDVFAITSEDYAPFDGDKMVGQLMVSMPKEAKGSYEYNPETTEWNLTGDIFSPTPVQKMAVGEAFLGAVSFRSGDAGQDSFRGGGSIVCIRCLNCSTYETATGDGRRIHRGKIVIDAAKIIKTSLKSIDALIEAWGLNREAILTPEESLTAAEFVSGLYRNMLRDRSSDYVGVIPGRVEKNVPLLTAAYFDQRRDKDRIVRSDLAQGITSHVQLLDRDVQVAAEIATGSWLVRQPRLRYDSKE